MSHTSAMPEERVPDLLRGLLTAGLGVYECCVAEPSPEGPSVEVVEGSGP